NGVDEIVATTDNGDGTSTMFEFGADGGAIASGDTIGVVTKYVWRGFNDSDADGRGELLAVVNGALLLVEQGAAALDVIGNAPIPEGPIEVVDFGLAATPVALTAAPTGEGLRLTLPSAGPVVLPIPLAYARSTL